jgi:hypothetical protein
MKDPQNESIQASLEASAVVLLVVEERSERVQRCGILHFVFVRLVRKCKGN